LTFDRPPPMKKLLLAAAFAAFVVPPTATAGDVTMRVHDVSLGARTLESAAGSAPFNMLGLHWIGSGTVAYRTRRPAGSWRAWRTADADNRSGSWHDGNLDWTGIATAVQFRVRGSVRRLRSYEVSSRVTTAPVRTVSAAGEPTIVPRAAWGANEEIVRATPILAPTLRLAVVHHTAGTNSYTRAQAAAIVRGIEVYHVQGNGWNDIGYNFLVDRFGTIYEGRGGGVDRNVIGAHAQGFNSGTVGVALIGNYVQAVPPPAQRDALVRLLAWRLDVAHIDPLSTVVYTSGGNAKFRAGKIVTLRAVSGHRDTGPSECPGNGAYAFLPALAKRVAATGLPKLYAPTVAGVVGSPVRFQARLSSVLAWTVTVADRTGKTVASGAGEGSVVDWTWRSAGAPTGAYTWTIAAPGLRVASGVLGKVTTQPPPAPLSLTNLAATPSVVAPAADGTGSTASVGFTLGGPALVTASVFDSSGASIGSVLDEQRPAGNNTFSWQLGSLPDGRYRLTVTATAGSKSVTKAADVIVDRTLAGLVASARAISPNADGVADRLTLSYTLTQNAPVRIDLEQAGVVAATLFQGQPGVGQHTVDWDGTADGAALPDGQYLVVVTVTDALGDVQLPLPLAIDTTPPVLKLLDAARLRFSVSEPATVTVLVNQRVRIVQAAQGTFTVPYAGSVSQVSAEAQDAAGNLSAIVSG
jgi:flagellar hook assembly protein FlgD